MFVFFSCGKTNHHPINTVEEVKVYDNDVISITSKGRHYDYQKVTIENHDFLLIFYLGHGILNMEVVQI